MNVRLALALPMAVVACQPPTRAASVGDPAGVVSSDPLFVPLPAATIIVSRLDSSDGQTRVRLEAADSGSTWGFFMEDSLYISPSSLLNVLASSGTVLKEEDLRRVDDTAFRPKTFSSSGVPVVNAKRFAKRLGAYIATDPPRNHATIWPREVLLFLLRHRERLGEIPAIVGARAEGVLPP